MSCSNKTNAGSLPQLSRRHLFPSEICKPLVNLKSFNNLWVYKSSATKYLGCSTSYIFFLLSILRMEAAAWISFWCFLFLLPQSWYSCSNVDLFLRNVLLENKDFFFSVIFSIAQFSDWARLKMWRPNGWKLYMTLAFSHLQSAHELKIINIEVIITLLRCSR